MELPANPSTSRQSSTSRQPTPAPTPAPSADPKQLSGLGNMLPAASMDALKKKLYQAHHDLTATIESIFPKGEVCRDYVESQAENVLRSVRKTTGKCAICGKVFTQKSSTRLRQHIVRFHMAKEAQFPCDFVDPDPKKGQCLYVGGSQGELTEHKKIHRAKGKKGGTLFCKLCNRGFSELARLNEHNKDLHPTDEEKWDRYCKYCPGKKKDKKKFSYLKNRLAHELTCKFQPGGAPRFRCFFCESHFASTKNRNKHCRDLHPGLKFNPKEENRVRKR